VSFYDYECRECCIEFTAFQRLSDVPYLSCPDCGGVLKPLFTIKKEEDVCPLTCEPNWEPVGTDVHKEWSQRRKWKHGSVKSMLDKAK